MAISQQDRGLVGFASGAVTAFISWGLWVLLEGAGFSRNWCYAAIALVWVAGAIPTIEGGHRAFRTGVNTDVTAYAVMAGLFVVITVEVLVKA